MADTENVIRVLLRYAWTASTKGLPPDTAWAWPAVPISSGVTVTWRSMARPKTVSTCLTMMTVAGGVGVPGRFVPNTMGSNTGRTVLRCTMLPKQPGKSPWNGCHSDTWTISRTCRTGKAYCSPRYVETRYWTGSSGVTGEGSSN